MFALSLATFLALMLSAAATRCRSNPSHYFFKLGNFNGTVVSDGPIILEENFFDVSDRMLTRSFKQCFRGDGFPVVWQSNVLVLDIPNVRLLVDTGVGVGLPFAGFNPGGQLLKNLKAAGIHPDTIDAVLLTHGHPDHITGLTNEGKRSFPNAGIYVSKVENKFWTTDPFVNPNPDIPAISNSKYLNLTFKYTDELTSAVVHFKDNYRRQIASYSKVHLLPPFAKPFPGVRFIPVPGDTPGHSVIRITSRDETMMIIGDAFFSKPDSIRRPKWRFIFASDPRASVRNRLQLLDWLARRGDLVLAYHEEFPGLGYIEKAGRRFDWITAPAKLQGIGVKTLCARV